MVSSNRFKSLKTIKSTYLDAVLTFSMLLQEHIEKIEQSIWIIKKVNLKIQLDKFLNTRKKIKPVFGLLGCFRRFIKDFAKFTKPLTPCLKMNTKITHDSKFVVSLTKCKKTLLNGPIFQYPDFIILTTHASDVPVLSQGSPGSERPVAYASGTLNKTKHKIQYYRKGNLSMGLFLFQILYFYNLDGPQTFNLAV